MIAKLFKKVTKHITPSPSGRKGWGLMGTVVLSGLALVSCVDTVILPDNKTVEEDFWQTKEDVALMVNGAYSGMTAENLQERLIVWTMRSDELNFNTALNNNNLNQIYSANIQTTNTYAGWGDLYSVINRCNLVIDKSASVMDIDPNYLEGDHLNNVAQMKALRALAYFYLVRVFRDVPLILEPYKKSSQEMNVPQEAPGRVIDQIIADLEEVKDHTLSSQSINDWTRNGYITRDGIYALLADVYLWKASVYGDESCYDKCIKCCDVIRANRMRNSFGNTAGFGSSATQFDDDGYDLNPSYDYYNVFLSGKNDKESLFELYFANNASLRKAYHKTANTTTAQPVFYTNSVYGTVASGDNSLFNHDNYKYDVRGFESIYSFDAASDEGYMIRKFVADEPLAMANKDPQNEVKNTQRYIDYRQNWILYRITDVMLMKAEALVQKALLQSKANAGLLDQIAAATTVEDSLAIAQEMYQINQSISKCNVKAARLAQIVNLRALTKTDLTQVIDSTKYAVSNTEYDGVDASSFIRTQMNAFVGFASAAEELELFIMEERARELCFEGKRWFDMLRFNYRHVENVNYDMILAEQGSYIKNYDNMLKLISRKYTSGGGSGVIAKMPTEPFLYMPVAQSEMSVNSMLKQNPVYSDGATMEKNY